MKLRRTFTVLAFALGANLVWSLCACCPEASGGSPSTTDIAAARCCDGEPSSSCRPSIRQPSSVAVTTAPTSHSTPTDLPMAVAIATATPHVRALAPAHPSRTPRNGLFVLHAQLLI